MTSNPRAGAPPGKKSGPGGITTSPQGHSEDPVATTATTNTHSVQAVTGVAYAPAGRRSRWLCVVEICPHCGQAHAHYGTRLAPPNGVRTTTCGKAYRVYAIYGGRSNPPAVSA